MDVYVESRLLLEKLANSIYDRDRDQQQLTQFFFTIKEVHIVEEFIEKIKEELQSGGRSPQNSILD